MTRAISPVIAIGALLILSSPASAQAVREGKIRILGRATIEVVPDSANLTIGVANKASNATVALDQNSATVRKVIDFAKKFGIEERDIQTSAIDLNPAAKTIREPNGNTRQEPDGYQARNTVRVRLREVTRLGAFMRQALDQGATNINAVEFGLSEAEKYRDEARADAVKDAIRQAKLVVEAANVRLGAISEIIHPPRTEIRSYDGAQASLRRAPLMSVPVEAGTVQISAEVDITWVIE